MSRVLSPEPAFSGVPRSEQTERKRAPTVTKRNFDSLRLDLDLCAQQYLSIPASTTLHKQRRKPMHFTRLPPANLAKNTQLHFCVQERRSLQRSHATPQSTATYALSTTWPCKNTAIYMRGLTNKHENTVNDRCFVTLEPVEPTIYKTPQNATVASWCERC